MDPPPPLSENGAPSESSESQHAVEQPISPLPAATPSLFSPDPSGAFPPTPVVNHEAPMSPRSEGDGDPYSRIRELEEELGVTRQEKETLGNQYRSLLGKLTAMRQSLGDKLREDAEELDRRESQITNLTTELSSLQSIITQLQTELLSSSTEASLLTTQLASLRSESSSSSSDVLALTRDIRELRGELERLRQERDEWEEEVMRERSRREEGEEEMRRWERRRREEEGRLRGVEEELGRERERAGNLQDVLGEFQAAKDLELRQATQELETQLRHAAQSLSEYKLRAANSESRLAEVANDASRSNRLEKELREKNGVIGKLRHEAVLTQEHLTEALRRLRRNTSDTNVDRRLVTNILLQFLQTPRADPKRFEMLSLLSTILSWEDNDREKAGLQRTGGGTPGKGRAGGAGRKGKEVELGGGGRERTKEEEETFNETFSNLFVEFLLKEAAQGQSRLPKPSGESTSPGATTPTSPPNNQLGFSRQRTASSVSLNSAASGYGGMKSPPLPLGLGSYGRKASYGLAQAMGSPGGSPGEGMNGGTGLPKVGEDT